MRISFLKKIFILLCFSLPATLFCDNIFVEFAQALEVIGKPISHIVIDFGNVSKALPKERQNLVNSIAEQKIEAPWDLKLKASDEDFKKTLGKWLTETGNKKSPQDLEYSWEKTGRLEKPKDNLTKKSVEKKLKETQHKIRNIVAEDAFIVVPPIKNPTELKGDIALFALSFDQMSKNINTATPDDLRKIDYYIDQSKATIDKAKNSTSYNDASQAIENLLNLTKANQKSITKNYKTITDNVTPLKELDSQIETSLKQYIGSGISQKSINLVTKQLPAKFSGKETIEKHAETTIEKNPDLLLTSIIEKPIQENEYKTLIKKLKEKKIQKVPESQFNELLEKLNSAQETLITQSGLNFTDKTTEKIKSMDNWLSKTKDGNAAWHSDTLETIIQKLIFISDDLEKTIEAENRVWKRKDLIPYLYCLGVPRLGLILSAQTEKLNTTFEASFEKTYKNLKDLLISLLKTISLEYNKKRLNALLSYEFKDDPKPKLDFKPDLKLELDRFKKIDKKFAEELQQDWDTLKKAKEAIDEWTNRKGPENEKPQSVEKKLEDIEKQRETEWSNYFYNELKTQTNQNFEEKTLITSYYPQSFLNNTHKKFIENLKIISERTETIWNLDKKDVLELREILKSFKGTNKITSKDAWNAQLEFFPFIFIAACLDPSLIVDEIPALLDRLFALKENDIKNYSTKRLRYLIALNNQAKKDQKIPGLDQLDEELTYFFDLMSAKKYSSQAIEEILTETT